MVKEEDRQKNKLQVEIELLYFVVSYKISLTRQVTLLIYILVCSALVVPKITPTTSIGRPSLVRQQHCAINILIIPRLIKHITIINVA